MPVTIQGLRDAYLAAQRTRMVSGEIGEAAYMGAVRTTDLMLAHLDPAREVGSLRPDDFRTLRAALAQRLSPAVLRIEIGRIRRAFRFAAREGLAPAEVNYGDAFNWPTQRALRQARNERGPLLFDAAELRLVLDALEHGVPASGDGKRRLKPNPQLRAMVLLGINGGLGNTDVALLPKSAIDWRGGWLDYPRVKTAIQRRIPLWPETLTALRAAIEAIEARPEPADPADEPLVFLAPRTGGRWLRLAPTTRDDGTETFTLIDSVGERFRAARRKLGIDRKPGLGFYTLRRTFETVAGESRDQVAVDSIMGHVDPSMGAIYRQGISDERLRAVVEGVRAWLWPGETTAAVSTTGDPRRGIWGWLVDALRRS